MNRNVCLAACFLPLNEENCSWWLRLQDELAARGLDLVLLSTAPPADTRLHTILAPLWLKGFAEAYGATECQATLEAPLADALARRDRSWLGQDSADLDEFKTGVIACQEVFRSLFEELQPALVLAWGNSLAQSVILQQLAAQQGRPCWVIERGLLPGTLMIEMAGQGGQTELNWSFNLQNAWRNSEDISLFAAAQEICRSRRSTKYAQADYLTPELFHQKFNPVRKPLIALLLQHDAASCLVPHDFAGAKIHSPVFASSLEAITQLAAAATEANCRLIVKPHPIDQTDYSKCESAFVSIVRDVNLHSLIVAADVVAAMTSTAQFEALLHEKPLLLLARSALADKDVAYEVKAPSQLRPMLRAALNRDNFPLRHLNAQRFVTFLLQNFSVSLADEVPTGSTLADLARFLSQNAVAAAPSRSLEDSLTAFGDWLMLWESRPKSAVAKTEAPRTNAQAPKLNSMNYQSHIGQDAWVAECLNFKRTGYFLDFGAFDGKTISNTYALEKDLGWKGICVEPNPRYYPQVCECRNVICVNVALWQTSRQQLRFVDAHGLSAIESFKSGDINSDRRAKATTSVIEVDTLNPNELLERFSAPKLIDYLTLDVEGAEFDILSALDLNKYAIALMTIEHNHDTPRQQQIRDYLAQFGYEVVQNRNDDFFFHRDHLKALTGRNIDPVAIFQHIYTTYPIAETGKEKPAPAAANNGKNPRNTASQNVLDALAKSPDALRTMCSTLSEQGSWAEAGEIYTTLTNKLPDDFDAWHGRLECARKLGHIVMADLILEEALERHPEWAPKLGAQPATATATLVNN